MRRMLLIVSGVVILSACGGGGGGADGAQTTSAPQVSGSVTTAPTPAAPTAPPVQAGAITLSPGDDLQAAVDAAPEGARFVFRPGIYPQATIKPKNNQTFVGQDGAVLSGAMNVTGWVREGRFWTVSGYPTPQFSHGPGRDGMAQYREDLIIDGVPQVRVGAFDKLEPGAFYYQDGRVWIVTDPNGRETLAMRTPAAFEGAATRGVTIENLVIRYYASMAQHGAIEAQKTTGWTLKNVVAERNHGAGVAAGSGMTITGGRFSGNGHLGIHGQDLAGLKVTGATLSANNYAGFDRGWDAGGAKILTSTDIQLVDNLVFDNLGPGLWLDWENENVRLENNYVHGNAEIGIQFEASRNCAIVENTVEFNNTSGEDVGYWSSEILIQNSSNCEVRGNHVASNAGQGIGMIYDKRGEGRYGPHYTRGNTVSGNTIIMAKPGLNGLVATADKPTMYDGSNSLNGNTYIAANQDSLRFTWNDAWFTAASIQAHPIEKQGVFRYVSDPSSNALRRRVRER